jgi:hypothetical protein
MRIVLFALVCIFSPFIYGQHSLPIIMDTNEIRGEITAFGVFDYTGTSIQNKLSDKFIYGGFIDNQIKDASMDKHRTHNKYGIELASEIDYRSFPTGNFLKGKYGFYIRGGYGGYASASYSQDLFGLMFYGNQRYTGDTANFSGTEFNMVSFQKIGFGLTTKNRKSSIGINYYNISQFADAFIREGALESDSTGNNQNLLLDARLQYAEGLKFNKGWGIGLDGDFRFQAAWIKDRTAFFQAQFKNIGIMNIGNVTEYKVDSSYTYSGLKFNQLLGENSFNTDNPEDLLDTLGVKETTRNVTAFLPGFVQIGKIVDEHTAQNIQSYFGVRLYTTLAYNPLVFVGMQFKAYDWMKVGVHGIYGGFAKFRLGFYTQYRMKKWQVGIGSENILGALSSKGKGQSLHLRITMQW